MTILHLYLEEPIHPLVSDALFALIKTQGIVWELENDHRPIVDDVGMLVGFDRSGMFVHAKSESADGANAIDSFRSMFQSADTLLAATSP